MKQVIRFIVSLILSAVCLWLAFRNVDFHAAIQLLGQVNFSLIALYLLTLVFIQIVRAIRWDILIRPFVSLSKSAVFRNSNLGMMLVLVLPLRLGEFARPYMLKKEHSASLSAGLGAIVVERTIDGLLVTLFFFVSTIIFSDNKQVPAGLHLAAVMALLFFTGALVVVVASLLWRDLALRLLSRILHPISPKLERKLTGMVSAFVDGLRALPDFRSVVGLFFWSLAYWGVNGAGFYWVMRAFGWSLPFTAGLTVVSIIVIAIMIPAGPGFIGTYQIGITQGLAIYGISANAAAAYGLIVYPLNILVVIAFGLPYLFMRKANISELIHA
ncbi:MAG: flippase-like domain-containing protein, partial [Deltaproteobacteria bacterium]|nr:flippase-like domain-containing protein [Deltaproteobacteria bacterium]